MQKTRVLVVGVLIVSSLMAGCGQKNEVSKNGDNKVTQLQTVNDNKNLSTAATDKTGASTSTTQISDKMSQLLQEEKRILDNKIPIKEADEKKYPMLAVQKYLLVKYDGQADFGKKDVRVMSDTEIVYFCNTALNNSDDYVFKKVTMRFDGSQWTAVNDESFDPKNY